MVRMTRRNLAPNFIGMTSACGGGEAKTNTRPQDRGSTMSRDRIEPQVHSGSAVTDEQKWQGPLAPPRLRCICN